MNYPRLALAAVVATIVYFLYGFLVEGLLIRKDFSPYPALYRSADTVMKYMPLGLASTFLAIFLLTVLYAKGCAGAPGALAGAYFGLLAGIFVACVHPISNFVTLNMGAKLGLEIAASVVLQWTIVGMVIALVYKPAMAASR